MKPCTLPGMCSGMVPDVQGPRPGRIFYETLLLETISLGGFLSHSPPGAWGRAEPLDVLFSSLSWAMMETKAEGKNPNPGGLYYMQRWQGISRQESCPATENAGWNQGPCSTQALFS